MSKPVWVSVATLGVCAMIARRIGGAFDTHGLADEIANIIEYHAPSEAVADAAQVERLQRRLNEVRANVG